MISIISHRRIPFAISGLLFLASVLILATIGLKPGIDFTGGSLIELSFSESRPAIEDLRSAANELGLGAVSVQPVDEDGALLKLRELTEAERQTAVETLQGQFETEQNQVQQERAEVIGPAISSQLRNRAFGAGVAVVVAIILYVAYAFRKVSKPISSWKYGIAAIVALIHDVTIVMAVFAILGKTAGVEVDIPFVVALLTILGYSVNDTIVVFDRVRESLLGRVGSNFEENVNTGVNKSITRSINTSLTTLVVLVSLYFFGGASVQYFALALIIGIIAGTYSSIFLASPLLVAWHQFDVRRAKRA
jgi:preprotein translocase subunit SecF